MTADTPDLDAARRRAERCALMMTLEHPELSLASWLLPRPPRPAAPVPPDLAPCDGCPGYECDVCVDQACHKSAR